MRGSLYLRYMARESRGSGGRLIFFVVCLAVGVAAVVAVAGLSSSMDGSLRAKARELLAADLVVESRQPLPDELSRWMSPDIRRCDIREMVTVVAAGSGPASGASRLAELKVIDGEYPFYGRLETEPGLTLGELLGDGATVVADELLTQLELRVGDTLKVGGIDFRIAAALLSEPDKVNVSFTSIAPRVFLSGGGLARTGLETRGSRVLYRALLKMPEGSSAEGVKALALAIRREHPDPLISVETYSEAQPMLRAGIDRAEQFLGLVALLSLLVGGIGVAQTVRAWLAGKMESIAVLKCLGLRPREVVALYLGQTALLGLLGSLVGVAVGVGVQWIAPRVVGGFLPAEFIDPWQPAAMVRGIVLGTGIAVLFSLPALLAIRQVPPARVLRRDADPLPVSPWARLGIPVVLVAGVFLTSLVQSRSALIGAEFTGLLVVVVVLLGLAALALSRFASKLPRGVGRVWIRHGLTALGRPGAATLGAITALGMGVVVVLAMYVIETRLSAQFDADVPQDAPTAFLVDIQPDQWDGIRALLEKEGALSVNSAPMVSSRLESIDGVPVEEVAKSTPRSSRWVLTREQRLSYMKELPDGNRIIEGELWSLPDRPEVSVERDYADDLGVDVGSTLVFDVQGVPMEFTVGSIRAVDWQTFGINFFIVVEPGILEEAPQFRVATVNLPAGSEQRLQDTLVAGYPNVTLIRIREILDKVVAVLGQAGLGVRLLGAFTIAAGILILAGVVSAGSIRRGREVALLKTLGMTRGGVVAVYAVEYGLVGLVAGVIGTAGGGLVSWAVLAHWMEIPWEPPTAVLAVSILGTVFLAVVAGIA
ncbi:MAG: FtsX-like permease family protein, partial [Acidobacteriota bacterium]|nr:FtsX-like permease family protein [Acidobacteriota bacterium]